MIITFKYYKLLDCLQLKTTGLTYHYTCQLHILMATFESFSSTEKIVKFSWICSSLSFFYFRTFPRKQ